MVEPAQIRYTRCQYVVGDVLTDLMRAYMMFSKIPFDTIEQAIMGDSKFRKKINQKEIDKVQTLTTHGFTDFDISLMFKIARHKRFAMIIPGGPTHGWDSYPQEGDSTIGDNILRITVCRNEITHMPNTALSEDEFSKMFKTYNDIGKRADIHITKRDNHFTQRINKYRSCSLDEQMEARFKREIEVFKSKNDIKRVNHNIKRFYSNDTYAFQIYKTNVKPVLCT